MRNGRSPQLVGVARQWASFVVQQAVVVGRLDVGGTELRVGNVGCHAVVSTR